MPFFLAAWLFVGGIVAKTNYDSIQSEKKVALFEHLNNSYHKYYARIP